MPLWTADEIFAATAARLIGRLPAIEGVSIDTRTIAQGDLFVALLGENRDGHAFVPAAFDKGASAALVDEAHAEGLDGIGPLVVVPDVMAAIADLGRAARARLSGSARVVAVTGSVGKTSTKEALRHVLAAQGRTHAAVASYNNHWGVPLTLMRTPRDIDFGVYEIGMNAPGEIEPLARMVRPHVAVITTVEPVHMEAFASLEGIADEKAAIFKGLEPDGVGIINADNPHAGRLASVALKAGARIVTFGENAVADVQAKAIALDADGSEIAASLFGETLSYRLGLPGRHQALNSLAVLAAADALGADPKAAAASLAGLTPVSGRGMRQEVGLPGGGAFMLVDESYNANPASMRAALSTASAIVPAAGGRRIAVLGDMLELGPQADAFHAGLAEAVIAAKIDLLFASGPLMRHLVAALPASLPVVHAPDSASLEPQVLEAVGPGDVVMIKGSLSSRMGRIVTALKGRTNGKAA